MTGEAALGFVMWAAMFGSAFWLKRRFGATPSTVSRNQTGPKWEQDSPLPECFDEMEDDPMAKDQYDPKRVAQLEHELLGVPLPPEYRSARPALSHLQPMDAENEAEIQAALDAYDIEDDL